MVIIGIHRMGFKRLFSLLLLFLIGIFYGQSAAHASDINNCSVGNAIYKPILTHDKSGRSFAMRISQAQSNEVVSSRILFFLIDFYGHPKKISTIRLGYGCSNGVSVCRASAYWGQYKDNKELENIKNSLVLDVIFLSKSFHQEYLSQDLSVNAPYAVLFPNSAAALFYSDKSTADKYMKFYTNDHTFPDFPDSDVWVLSDCQKEKN